MFKKKINIIPLLAVIIGLFIGSIIMLVSGYDPLEAYSSLLKGAGIIPFSPSKFGNSLIQMTTLILTGLSVSFAFRTGLFNIGASGQMLMGGFGGVLIGIYLDLPKFIHLPLAVLVAMIFGTIWAFIPGLLKALYGVHEVVTTIMMNWIAYWTVYYFVTKFIKGHYDTESKVIKETASLKAEWLTSMFQGTHVHLGLLIALLVAIIVWVIIEKTTFGYELKAVGYNRHAAKYGGIKVNLNIIYSMMFSGALAGLAGATYYLGYTNNIKVGILPSQGFDGIAVALLGLNTVFGVILAAFLFGILNAGTGLMQTISSVPPQLVSIITALIIFISSTHIILNKWSTKLSNNRNKVKKGDNINGNT